MRNTNRSILVVAENNGLRPGFNIYLDFSGQREYLMYHRHNGLLYNALKDGMHIDEIKRYRCSYRSVVGKKLANMIAHLEKVIDEYLADRAAYYDA